MHIFWYLILRMMRRQPIVFKDVSEDDSQEACYEMVEDEDEMQAVFKVFEQMLDDVDLEM